MTWNKKQIIEGEVYGELTVICEAPTYVYPSGRKRRRLLCSCSCGSEPKEYMINAVVGGNTTSCGCVNLARISKAERLNAALALYKAAKDAGTVRRVQIGAQST